MGWLFLGLLRLVLQELAQLSPTKPLYRPKSIHSILVRRAGRVTPYAEVVTVRILYIHLPDAPRHIRRCLPNDCAALLIFLM